MLFWKIPCNPDDPVGNKPGTKQDIPCMFRDRRVPAEQGRAGASPKNVTVRDVVSQAWGGEEIKRLWWAGQPVEFRRDP
jgi:hypothetical protein